MNSVTRIQIVHVFIVLILLFDILILGQSFVSNIGIFCAGEGTPEVCNFDLFYKHLTYYVPVFGLLVFTLVQVIRKSRNAIFWLVAVAVTGLGSFGVLNVQTFVFPSEQYVHQQFDLGDVVYIALEILICILPPLLYRHVWKVRNQI